MNQTNILTQTQDGLAIITINRPEKLNALNKETIAALHDALQQADEDQQVRAIVLTGSGEKAFVAGADIAEFADFSVAQGSALAADGQKQLFDFIEQLGKPVIAAVNGFALGGGLELAMACHFRVASDNARMGLPEVTLGVIPGYGGTQRLPQLVGKGRAFEMIMTGGMIGSEEAKSYGLVNHVVPQAELISFVQGLAQKIIRNAPTALSAAISAVNAGFRDGTDGYATEVELFGKCFGTGDFKEGTTAFLEKRKPDFKGN